MKIVRGSAVDCSTLSDPVTVQTTGDDGRYTSIAIGLDGNPIISDHDNTSHDLKVAQIAR